MQNATHEFGPSPCLEVRAHVEHAFCVRSAPEDGRALQAQVDDAPDGALHRAAAQGQALPAESRVAHPVLAFHEVVDLRPDGLGVSSLAEFTSGFDDAIDASGLEVAAHAPDPALPLLRRPTGAEIGDGGDAPGDLADGHQVLGVLPRLDGEEG